MAWNDLPRPVQIAVASLTAFFTTLGAGAAAWPVLEPWLAAHRGYVRFHTAEESTKLRTAFEPTRTGMYDIQISIARNRRATINHQIISLEIEAPKSETAADLIARRQQLEKLREELVELDAEIRTLRSQREKN